MPTLLLGVVAGFYIGNQQFRTKADNTVKNLFGKGVDILNNRNAILPQPTPAEDKAEGE